MSDFPLFAGAPHKRGLIDAANSRGVAVSANASSDTLGTREVLIASTECDAIGGYIRVTSNSPGSVAQNLINVYIGPSGSEELILEGYTHFHDNSSQLAPIYTIPLPINIPKGSRITVDMQSSVGGHAQSMIFYYIPETFSGRQGFGTIDSFGVDTASSQSSITINAGSTANTKGDWEQIASTAENVHGYKGFFLSLVARPNSTSTIVAHKLIDIGIGDNPNEVIILPDIHTYQTDSETYWFDSQFFEIDIPPGVRIAARAQCSSTSSSARNTGIIFHGVR